MEREPPHGLEALDLLSPGLPLVGGVTYGLHAVAGARAVSNASSSSQHTTFLPPTQERA